MGFYFRLYILDMNELLNDVTDSLVDWLLTAEAALPAEGGPNHCSTGYTVIFDKAGESHPKQWICLYL